MAEIAKSVASVCEAVKSMSDAWCLARTLMGGTAAMRRAGKTYLPQWPNEEDESYANRLATSVLFPAYSRTIITLAAKPFSKPVTISEDTPERIQAWLEDIDLQGRNIDTFAADILEAALGWGLAGILVEYPVKPEGVRTQADEQSAGLRPYMVQIKCEQLLGWKAKRVKGEWVLTQLRFMETVEEDDGPYGVTEVQQVRVLMPGGWEIHRKSDRGDWVVFDNGLTTLNYIPFVPVYGQRLAFMVGRPPLIELAHLNVKHWQSQSDQDTILHVARVPILTARQVGDDFSMTIGSGSAVNLGSGPEAKLEYVEHTGAAIEAGRQSLEDLKDEMRQAGAELLVMSTVQKTATETASEDSVGKCALQKIAEGLEDALDQALQIMADWIGEKDGGSVDLYDEYGVTLSDATTQMIKDWVAAGLMSKEAAFKELQRRGSISPDLVWDDVKAQIDAEGPALGTLGLGGDPNANGQ